MSRNAGLALAVVALSVALSAGAQAQSNVYPGVGAPGHWSVISGETVSTNADVISAELGYPGISVGWLHGMNDKVDIGVKADLDYGVFYTTNSQFGLGLKVPFRFMVLRRDKVSLQFHIDPGIKGYFPKGDNFAHTDGAFALAFPVGATLGIAVSPELRLGVGFDLPMFTILSPRTDFVIGPQFGGGLEYFVDKNLSVGLNTRFGPIFVPTAYSGSQFGFLSQVVVGFRM